MLLVDTSVLPKLRKCCHEVTADLCRKSQVALQDSSIEVVTFFLKSASFRVPSRDFRKSLPKEMMIFQKKKKISIILAIVCDTT